MIIGMDVFEKYAKTLISAPESLFKLCMSQYGARAREHERRIRAEKQAEELKHSRSAVARQMREDHEEHKKTGRELEKYKAGYEKQTRDSEKLRSERDSFRGMVNRAMEMIPALKEQVKQLRKRAEDAESELDSANKQRDAAVADSEMSQKEISHLQDQVSLHGKARFDSSTEKTANLFHGIDVDEDPLDEDAPADGSHNYSADEVIRKIGEMIEDEELLDETRPSDRYSVEYNARGISIHKDKCGYSKEELDQMFADEADYRVYSSNKRVKLARLRPIVYEVHEYAPKVVVRDSNGRKKYVKTLPYKNQFFSKSKCDPSLVVSVIYDKFEMGLPYNRLEKEFEKA